MIPSTLSAQNGRFWVGTCLVESQLNRIGCKESKVHIEPKVMQVLLRLSKAPNEVVTKDALIEAVWGDQVVTDDVLARAISALRKAFGDDPRQPTYIETIRKKGYRLIAPVRPDKPQAQTPALSKPILSSETHLVRSSLQWRYMVATVVTGLILLSGFVWLLRPTHPPQAWPTLMATPLTTAPGLEVTPSLSPQGDYIAYSATPDSMHQGDIYVQLLNQGRPHQLTRHLAHESSPAWSPDGNYVAFMRHFDTTCTVFVVPLIGGTERKIGSCGVNRFADLVWSQDGQWLAFNSRETEKQAFAIYLLAANGSSFNRLTSPEPSIWGDYDPAFSSDSRILAFSRSFSEGMQDLYTIAVEDGVEERITRIGRNMYGITWLPNNHSILFSSNQTGTYDIWQIDLATQLQELIYTAPLDQVNPTWHEATQQLVVEQRAYEVNLRTVDLNQPTSPASLIAPSTHWDLHPRISPSGSHIAFTSNRSGSYEIWTAQFDGTHPQQMTAFGGPFTSTPRWSPDSQRLVFDARPDGQADIFYMPTNGSSPTRLTTHAADDLAASWSRDGQWIYFASNRTGAWEIWRKAPSRTSNPEQVTTAGGFQALESLDGTTLYYTKHPEDGIWSRALDNPSERLVVADLQTADWGNWAVHSTGISYVQRLPQGKTPIALYAFDTRETSIIHTPVGYIPTQDPAFTASLDGNSLVYGLVDRRSSDLLMLTPHSEQ